MKRAAKNGPVCARCGRAGFIPPTLDDVKAYAAMQEYTFDVDRFYAHHAMAGWMLSKGREMKDWKAACAYWQTQERNRGTFGVKRTNTNASWETRGEEAVKREAYEGKKAIRSVAERDPATGKVTRTTYYPDGTVKHE